MLKKYEKSPKLSEEERTTITRALYSEHLSLRKAVRDMGSIFSYGQLYRILNGQAGINPGEAASLYELLGGNYRVDFLITYSAGLIPPEVIERNEQKREGANWSDLYDKASCSLKARFLKSPTCERSFVLQTLEKLL